jgi:hypothetical protein
MVAKDYFAPEGDSLLTAGRAVSILRVALLEAAKWRARAKLLLEF